MTKGKNQPDAQICGMARSQSYIWLATAPMQGGRRAAGMAVRSGMQPDVSMACEGRSPGMM